MDEREIKILRGCPRKYFYPSIEHIPQKDGPCNCSACRYKAYLENDPIPPTNAEILAEKEREAKILRENNAD